MIEKGDLYSRRKVLKEIEIFHCCRGHENILQMVEFFEEDDRYDLNLFISELILFIIFYLLGI